MFVANLVTSAYHAIKRDMQFGEEWPCLSIENIHMFYRIHWTQCVTYCYTWKELKG